MKRLSPLLDFATVFAAVLLFSACGNRHHALTQSTAYVGGDGKTNRVVNVEFDSGIRLVGQKLDLADLELTEEVGKDGWKYGVGASSASSSPESIALEYLVDAFKSSQIAQTRNTGSDLEGRMSKLEDSIADLATIAAALQERSENDN